MPGDSIAEQDKLADSGPSDCWCGGSPEVGGHLTEDLSQDANRSKGFQQ